MALMYDMETVNRAMTEASAFVSGPGVKLTSRERFVLNTFASMKPVEARPVVHARWEYSFGSYSTPKCSCCGWRIPYSEDSVLDARNYCPNCGAKMDGRVEA